MGKHGSTAARTSGDSDDSKGRRKKQGSAERTSGDSDDSKGRRKKQGPTAGDAVPVVTRLLRTLAVDAGRVIDELEERDERGLGNTTKSVFAKTRPLLAALIQADVAKSDADVLFESLDHIGSGAFEYRELGALALASLARRGDTTAREAKGGKGSKATPGKLGFQGVEDDGSAQSKFKGLSSGARAALRRKLAEERTSGEAEAVSYTHLTLPTICSV
eukprot:3073772-Prymnesium_polylepis.3